MSIEARKRLLAILTKKAIWNWEDVVNELSPFERREIRQEAEALTERAARFSGYLDARVTMQDNDGGHKKGVRNSNRVGAKVRRALGFTQARNDISF